jgi:hypothetical protein
MHRKRLTMRHTEIESHGYLERRKKSNQESSEWDERHRTRRDRESRG